MASIGESLRKKREALHVSLNHIHTETRISMMYLEALEEDRFDVFPAEIYLIGFLKKYSLYLKLNADELIDLYRRQKSADIKIKKIESQYDANVEKKENSLSVQQVIFLTAVILLGFGIFISFFFFLKNKNMRAEKNIEPESKRFLSVPAEYQKKSIALSLSIAAVEKSWIRVVSDGSLVFEGILPKEAAERWKAKKDFIITAQNWNSIIVSLNGRQVSLGELATDEHKVVIDQALLEKITQKKKTSI